MLMSFVNARLRDVNETLDDFCHDNNVDREVLIAKLRQAGFEYDAEHKRFW